MRNIFKKRAGDTSLLNMRLILGVENPDLLKKIEFFTVHTPPDRQEELKAVRKP